MNKKQMVMLAVLMGAVLPLQAVVLIEENFDASRAGRKPKADQVLMPSSTEVMVVDATTDPVDPFGGDLNRSLMIEDTGAEGPSVGWPTDGLELETEDLVLSVKAFMVDDSDWDDTFLIIQAGKNNAKRSTLNSIEAAVQMTLHEDRITVRTGAATWTIDETFDRNIVWDIQISIQPKDKTWSASINGTPLSEKGVEVFDFRNNADVDGINFISLTGQSTVAAQRIFFDDVKLERK